MDPESSVQAFKLKGELVRTPFPRLNVAIETILERLFALEKVGSICRQIDGMEAIPEALHRLLTLFDTTYAVADAEIDHVPAQGPAILVANHPFGAIEGIILAHLALRRRPDVKVMANFLLRRIPGLRDLFIGVDPFGGPGSAQRNVGPLREILRWVRQGGALVVFPAGAVSRVTLPRGRIADPPWQPGIGRIVQLTKAPVVPVYIHGANSVSFQLLGLLHPRLRTALIFRQLVNQPTREIQLRIGRAIPYERLRGLRHDADVARYLRLCTELLKQGAAPASGPALRGTRRESPSREPVIAPPPASLLAEEVAALPRTQHLVRSDHLFVYWARGEQIPWVLREIGRLREMTFRAVGEGTGKPADLDLYDNYYRHLFLWNHAAREVVGAYRIGRTDEILARYGKRGLYTYSLFDLKAPLLAALNPALELGRSFVRAEYQRSVAPLFLLWRGIGQLVAREPRYRRLFGPVSISGDYQLLSREVLVEYLSSHHLQAQLARHARPRHPYRGSGRSAWSREDLAGIEDLDLVSQMLTQIEPDRKGIPVLLRQYLRLGGRLLGFNVDPDFGSALDGLIMVDLANTEPGLLRRYLGNAGTARFLVYHKAGLDTAAESA